MEFEIKGNLPEDGSDKAKRIKDRIDTFAAELAVEMLDPEDIKKYKEIINKTLKKEGLVASLPYLRAFSAGVEFAMFAESQGMIAPTHAALKHVILEETKKRDAKVDKSLS